MSEGFPVHDHIDVAQGCTIFKSNEWWKAGLLYDNRGQRKIGIYLWKRSGDSWKRKQKYVIRSPDDWQRDRDMIDSLVQDLTAE